MAFLFFQIGDKLKQQDLALVGLRNKCSVIK
jgi:hypothetical protein